MPIIMASYGLTTAQDAANINDKLFRRTSIAGVDTITAELVQAGAEAMIDVLISVCDKIWKKA